MATGKARGRRRPGAKRYLRILVIVAAMAGFAAWYYREPVRGYSGTATAYSARVVCACRHIDGQSMRQCKAGLDDARLALVFISEDRDAASVTARIPLFSVQTATYRKGWGCVLEPWSG